MSFCILASKRLRRDSIRQAKHENESCADHEKAELESKKELSNAFKMASEMVSLAKHIDGQLK